MHHFETSSKRISGFYIHEFGIWLATRYHVTHGNHYSSYTYSAIGLSLWRTSWRAVNVQLRIADGIDTKILYITKLPGGASYKRLIKL
jgi:hypothetical protein